MTRSAIEKPDFLGFGLGLRPPHYHDILEHDPAIDWFEVISENYMTAGGQPRYFLNKIRERYPVVMHGVSLSIASTAPLNTDYLHDLKQLAHDIQPKWISDHLCWTGVHGVNLHDLLPVPYTEEALKHCVERISHVQDFLGRRIAIENVSSYINYRQSEMTEWEFIRELSTRADCWLILDVNNIFVSGVNHDFDVLEFMNAIPKDRVVQFHLAGHSTGEGCLIDTHDAPVRDEVLALFTHAWHRFGATSTMIERDDNIPPLDELLAELDKVRDYATFIPKDEKIVPKNGASPLVSVISERDSLAHIQARLQESILAPNEAALADIAPPNVMQPQDRLAVYQSAYGLRLLEIMRHDYPYLERWLGDEAFSEVAQDYIRKTPSRHPNARYFSYTFPEFLRDMADREKQSPGGEMHIRLATELAFLEKTLADAFDARDHACKQPDDLLAVPAEFVGNLTLSLHPSVNLLPVTTNVVEIYQAMNENGKSLPEATMSAEDEIAVDGISNAELATDMLLVWRMGREVRYRVLSQEEAMLLEAVKAGQNFAGICGLYAVYQSETEAPATIAAYLRFWLENNLITEFIIPVMAVNESG